MNISPPAPSHLFDSHVHFQGLLEKNNLAAAAIIVRAAAQGVERMIAVGGAPDSNQQACDIAREHPRQVRAAVGINRDQALTDWSEAALEQLALAPETVALGEIGLDFHHESATRAAQLVLFERMLALARQQRLPVIIHSRAAEAATSALLEQHVRAWPGAPDQVGVQHCFSGSRDFAERLLELGFFISFSGIVTFKNAGALREIAAMIPAERLLIETDAPWLTPEPWRGRPNEPANVHRVAEELARIRHQPLSEIALITYRNAVRLFGIE